MTDQVRERMNEEQERQVVEKTILKLLENLRDPDNKVEIHLGSLLVEDLGFDSVDFVTFSIFVQDEYPDKSEALNPETLEYWNYLTPRAWVDLVLNGQIPMEPKESAVDGRWVELPYGPEFLLVDEVRRFSASSRIIETSKRYSVDRNCIRDHRVGDLVVVPGVMLMEQVNQSALLLGLNCHMIPIGEFVPLRSLQCQFESWVKADSEVVAYVEATESSKDAFQYIGTLEVEGKIVARVTGTAGRGVLAEEHS